MGSQKKAKKEKKQKKKKKKKNWGFHLSTNPITLSSQFSCLDASILYYGRDDCDWLFEASWQQHRSTR